MTDGEDKCHVDLTDEIVQKITSKRPSRPTDSDSVSRCQLCVTCDVDFTCYEA